MKSDQEKDLIDYLEVWSQFERCSYPAEREAAQAAVLDMYAQMELPCPALTWSSSPLSMAISRAIVELKGATEAMKFDAPTLGSPFASWRDSFMGRGLKREIRDEVLLEMEDNLTASLGQSVFDSLVDVSTSDGWSTTMLSPRAWGAHRCTQDNQYRWGHSFANDRIVSIADMEHLINLFALSIQVAVSKNRIPETVFAEAFSTAGSLLGRAINCDEEESMRQYFQLRNLGRLDELMQTAMVDACYGQLDAKFLALPDFLASEMGLELETQRLKGLIAIARTAGGFLPHRKFCWLYERVAALVLNDRGIPHNESGPCISFEDGWEIYALNGIVVDKRLIMEPHTISMDEIEKEDNLELRRILISRFGEERFITESGAKVRDEDPGFGILYVKNMPGDEPIAMVKVTNSTACPDGSFKSYFIRVPPEISTARQAVAWTFSMDESEYEPQVES